MSNLRYVTRAQMREIENRAIDQRGISVDALMAAAGKAIADLVEERISKECVVVAVCGSGNNGGDGFVAARLLAERGFEVEAISIERSFDASTATGRAWRAAQAGEVTFVGRFKTRPMACIIDALFGTGLSRAPGGFERQLIQDMNKFDRRWVPVVSADVPSGLDADTGKPIGVAVEASATVTMGLPKIGFKVPESKKYVGELIVADLGLPPELLR